MATEDQSERITLLEAQIETLKKALEIALEHLDAVRGYSCDVSYAQRLICYEWPESLPEIDEDDG